MVFTSYEFIGFLLLTVVVYYLLPRKFQWYWLLFAGYVFYAVSGPENLIYIMVTTITTFLSGYYMDRNFEQVKAYTESHPDISKDEKKAYQTLNKKKRKKVFVLTVVCNLVILAVVKYSNFFIGNVNSLLDESHKLSFLNIALPLGISFYTFQSIGYLSDVYNKSVKAQRDVLKLALFVSFFPLVIQGPISRYKDLEKTLFAGSKFDKVNLSRGFERILWGFFKKLVVADRILPLVVTVTGNPSKYGGVYSLVGMVLYTVELYADFTGGIDITIGVAQMLGITVMENFMRPYFSKSLKEYWRRWHISMASWFRDYMFYPLSAGPFIRNLSKFSKKVFGNSIGKKIPVFVASFIVWLSTGIWHGANWNFVVWGLLNYVILMASEEAEPLCARFHKKFSWSNTRAYEGFTVIRTFVLICVLNLFDCYEKVSDTVSSLIGIFTRFDVKPLQDGSLLKLGMSGYDYLVVLFGVIVMFSVSLIQRSGSVREKISKRPFAVRYLVWFMLFVIILIFGAYGIGYDSAQFIYNRF